MIQLLFRGAIDAMIESLLRVTKGAAEMHEAVSAVSPLLDRLHAPWSSPEELVE